MKLCLPKEKIYHKILDFYLPEYQTIEHRLDLRKDLNVVPIHLCLNLLNQLEKNR